MRSWPRAWSVRGAASHRPRRRHRRSRSLTSGTTGAPKRFALAHDMVARHIVGGNKNYPAFAEDHSRRPPAFLYYPLANISGIYSVLPTLLLGHSMLLVERFSVDAWRDHIRR